MRSMLSAEAMTGHAVFNHLGERLGKVEDFMLDVESGRIRYAVLSFGGVLGVGNKWFAVPADALTVDAGEDRLLLDVDKSRLKDAPGFDKDIWPDFADASFGRSVYGFYGRTPYWM